MTLLSTPRVKIDIIPRPRIPELSASSSIDPMEALKTYLQNREDLKDISASMLEAAGKLLDDDVEVVIGQ